MAVVVLCVHISTELTNFAHNTSCITYIPTNNIVMVGNIRFNNSIVIIPRSY